jgi:hypothetical protein
VSECGEQQQRLKNRGIVLVINGGKTYLDCCYYILSLFFVLYQKKEKYLALMMMERKNNKCSVL